MVNLFAFEHHIRHVSEILMLDYAVAAQQWLLAIMGIMLLYTRFAEKWDGSAEESHLYCRITAIADVFDALGKDRVSKKAWPMDQIQQLLERQKGRISTRYWSTCYCKTCYYFADTR